MLCQVCSNAEATRRITDIIDGDKKTLALCEDCAGNREDIIDPDLIKAASSQLKPALSAKVVATHQIVVPSHQSSCPQCGMTWQEFSSTRRLGCPHDYEVFGDEVDRLLYKIHGSVQHAGRPSERIAGRLRRRRQRESLRKDLDAAIRAEDYERAAMLRDRLQSMEPEPMEGEDLGTL